MLLSLALRISPIQQEFHYTVMALLPVAVLVNLQVLLYYIFSILSHCVNAANVDYTGTACFCHSRPSPLVLSAETACCKAF